MGGGDTGPDPDEQARRIEALERENRELRNALISGAPHGESKEARQQPQASGATDASRTTVRGLLLGARGEEAYSHLVAEVLPPYAVGCLLTFACGAYGAYGTYGATGPRGRRPHPPDHRASAAVARAAGLVPTEQWHDGGLRWRRSVVGGPSPVRGAGVDGGRRPSASLRDP